MSSPVSSSEYPPIGDFAAIGNCLSLALVSREGSIDWWCPMRFDRPAVFAALLDARRGGRFSVRPTARSLVERRYLDRTNVLETTFATATGKLRLTDLMPLSVETNSRSLQSPHLILRELRCLEGEVEVEVLFEPRFAYGAVVPKLSDCGSLGLWCAHGGEALALRSELPLDLGPNSTTARGRALLRAGERRFLGLSVASDEPVVLAPLGEAAATLGEATTGWWRRWAERCAYTGRYRAEVVRSALALKLLAFAPSGAIVAAATTSLPEEIGGVRNWDYRYCWLRDASLTMRALLQLGYRDEARAFLGWLVHTSNLTWPELQVLYDVYGRTRIEERELDLAGYRGSRPVRVGNAACRQLQLDVYGEVVGAAFEYLAHGGKLAHRQLKRLRELGKTVCRLWSEPDDGIWEVRSGRRHHVYSKVMCWRALDVLLTIDERGLLPMPVERFRATREAIRASIEADGFAPEVGSYVQAFGHVEADASLLLMPSQGYLAAGEARMRSTFAFLERELCHNGLWHRYAPGEADGLAGGEGAFGICSFWAAEHLARRGELEAAQRAFERVLGFANDVGLFSEQIDPQTGALLGNYPQAFTHIGLINAALAIERARG
ncbi:MAG TPA: glycoside hydrolase family 15 protein [Myxococcales bacterium]|nr:glycoside hydrolase family 15 protein [Myxococcales bacterium]